LVGLPPQVGLDEEIGSPGAALDTQQLVISLTPPEGEKTKARRASSLARPLKSPTEPKELNHPQHDEGPGGAFAGSR
jgi:hypothetical protein